MLVLDTEVYSTRAARLPGHTDGRDCQVRSRRKSHRQKDLGLMAMSYRYVYVASVAVGASKNQFLKAVIEAKAIGLLDTRLFAMY